jgi:hypothetical protein
MRPDRMALCLALLAPLHFSYDQDAYLYAQRVRGRRLTRSVPKTW